MKEVVLFLLTYILVFVIYYLILNNKIRLGKKKKTNKKPIEVNLLETKYNIDIKKINYKRLLLVIAAISSLDITIIVTIVSTINSYIMQLLSLVLIFPLILISYTIIGKIYGKKGNDKNV